MRCVALFYATDWRLRRCHGIDGHGGSHFQREGKAAIFCSPGLAVLEPHARAWRRMIQRALLPLSVLVLRTALRCDAWHREKGALLRCIKTKNHVGRHSVIVLWATGRRTKIDFDRDERNAAAD
jgi:hypothetical protein